MKVLNIIFLALLLLPSEAWTQARKPASIAELASYRGADRESVLYTGAKTEGKKNNSSSANSSVINNRKRLYKSSLLQE